MGKAPFAVNFYWLKVNDHLLLKALGGGDLRTRDQTKVDKIKQAVLDLTSQEGLLGWSIAKLAKRAGVSPATVYIYYPNKDEMLKQLYREYSQKVNDYLTERVDQTETGSTELRQLMTAYYEYIKAYPATYLFLDQFANFPPLMSQLPEAKTGFAVEKILAQMKADQKLWDYHLGTMLDLIFYPLRAVATQTPAGEGNAAQLEELIQMVRRAILRAES